MADNEIYIPQEEEPAFKLLHESDAGTRVFSFDHMPQYGLLSPDPHALLIPVMSFAAFNPSSIDYANMVREGDLIQVTGHPESEIYKQWNPPPEYQIAPGFQRMYRVRMRLDDALDYPILVADESV